jgi:hypothetical protein
MVKVSKKALAVVPRTTPRIERVETKKKVNGAIIPKPTRAEIVEALVLKKYQEWVNERTKLAEEYKAASDTLRDIIRKELKARPEVVLDNMEISFGTYNQGEITLTYKTKASNLPGTVKEAYKQWEKLSNKSHTMRHDFDKATCRQEMSEALRCDPARVGALAKSPEIEATLRHIEANRPKPEVTHENRVVLIGRR